jgi:membrane protease YdiL (CAAX protease family)
METAHGFNGRSFALFLLLVAACIGSSIAGAMFFPGRNHFVTIVRSSLAAIGILILAIGSEHILKRDFGPESTLSTLGFKPSRCALIGLLLGTLGAILVIGLITASLWLIAPFRFEPGMLTATDAFHTINMFFWSNLGEELVFRGYLLLVLIKCFGLRPALAITAFIFGLFHLPGLSGLAALKMVLTTAAFSYLLSAAFLKTGTLWTAIALHFFANVFLHKVTGLSGGSALLKPIFQNGYPAADPGTILMFVIPLSAAWFLFAKSPRVQLQTATSIHPPHP